MSHGHGGHGVVEGDNKKIAILISVLALFLAIAETLGKSAQTDAHQPQRRSLQPVGLLSGQDHPQDHHGDGGGADGGRCQACQGCGREGPAGEAGQRVEGAGRALRERAQAERQGRGPQGADGARTAGRVPPRPRLGQVSQFRARLRRVPDRHRARLLLSHHRGDLPAVGRRGRGRARNPLHGVSACWRRMRCRSSEHIDRLPPRRAWMFAVRPDSNECG